MPLVTRIPPSQATDAEAWTRKLLDLASVRHNVVVYRPDNRPGSSSSSRQGNAAGSNRLDDALADGILQGIENDTTRSGYHRALSAIELYLSFHRIDQATERLADILSSAEADSPGRSAAVEDVCTQSQLEQDMFDALRWALAQDRPSVVESIVRTLGNRLGMFMEQLAEGAPCPPQGPRPACLDDPQSYGRYWQLYSLEFVPKTCLDYFLALLAVPRSDNSFFYANDLLCARVDDLVRRLAFPHQRHGNSSSPVAARHAWRPEDDVPVHRTSTAAGPAHIAAATACHHLFVWSVLMMRYELAQIFWLHGGHAMQNSLLASQLLRSMARSRQLRPHLRFRLSVCRDMKVLADRFESDAKAVLDVCHDVSCGVAPAAAAAALGVTPG